MIVCKEILHSIQHKKNDCLELNIGILLNFENIRLDIASWPAIR